MNIVNEYTSKTDVMFEDKFRSTLMTKKNDNQFFIKEEFFIMRENTDNKKEYVVFQINSEGLCTRIK